MTPAQHQRITDYLEAMDASSASLSRSTASLSVRFYEAERGDLVDENREIQCLVNDIRVKIYELRQKVSLGGSEHAPRLSAQDSAAKDTADLPPRDLHQPLSCVYP